MRNQTKRSIFAAAALGLLSLTGCEEMDPLTKHYAWRPTDINRHNIAAMASRPPDLVRGRGDRGHPASGDLLAIDHINTGKPVALPSASSSGGGGGGGT